MKLRSFFCCVISVAAACGGGGVEPGDPVCGDGVLDDAESCEDGNTAGGDGCSATCASELCGNGQLELAEVCDDGNTASGDGCSASCASDETCGNGVLDPGESCDDGGTEPGDGCSAACVSEYCGNGVVDGVEVCDDGDTVGGDGCDATCSSDETCGNGVLDPGEECEDDNQIDGDGCSATCQLGATPYIYTVRESDDVLRRYNVITGAMEDLGPLGVPFAFGELAYDADADVLYMVGGRDSASLYAVNRRTGAATLVGAHGVVDLFGLGWDPRTDTLLGSRGAAGFETYVMNQATGAATLLGNGPGYDGIAYDSARDRLVGLRVGTGDFYAIDPATGAGTLLHDGAFVDNGGLAYDPVHDVYWVFDWEGQLYRYDPATFARTTVLTDLTPHDGAAFAWALD